jgi:polygalacturonase
LWITAECKLRGERKEYRDLNKLTPEIATEYPAAPIIERTPVYRDFTFNKIIATVESRQRAGLIGDCRK